ncbi:MAG: hypothetical protein M1817_006286 [Caeruleum heppii]|nr:MAG: hypothetical protein M1817_006286 [Caeruleum heppii]
MASYTHQTGDTSEKGCCEQRSNGSQEEKGKRDSRRESMLRGLKTANSFTISPEVFEKMYLSPETPVKGDLRKTFGNPTPLGLLGYLLSLSPLACDLMGWRGAGGDGAASIGAYYFIGGVLMLLSGVLEFLLGNTFPFVVFCSFGGFFLSLGATMTPFFHAYGAYSADAANPAAGLQTEGYQASFGFYMLFMAVLCLIYLVCALRTNIVFVLIFLGLFMTFAFLTGTHWELAQQSTVAAGRLTVAAGAWGLVACVAGWYIFLSQMLAALDFPFALPVGDLSHLIKGASQKVAKDSRFDV